MGEKIRAFIALKTPPEWDTRLADLQTTIRQLLRRSDVKWVKPEQIHITLRFLGYIPVELVSSVVEATDRVAREFSPFEVGLGALGCFPSSRRPRVLWVGLRDTAQRMKQLQARIARETAQIGEPAEDRDFTPHLTLARIKELNRQESALFERALETTIQMESNWGVSEVLLMQSRLAPSGATYEVLHASPLQRPPEIGN